MAGPLHGLRIVDVTSMISGPLATMLLGDQGADVIKIEPPVTGDLVRGIGSARAGIAPIFATSNRNKRSVVINLKEPRGVELLKRLVGGADAFVQNFRPGAADRMGIGESVLREVKPDLVYVSISGFGERGPYRHKRVYDPVIQALSGLASIQGDRVTGRPRMVRTIVPDKLTAMTAAQAITAALLSRERTGEGQHVRLAMLDSMISFLWPEGMARYTFVDQERTAPRRAQTLDLVFETQDGYITAGAVSDREWAGLARAAGHPEWIDDPRFKTTADRLVNWDGRLGLMADALKTRTSSEWLERLEAEDVPCAPILRRKDLLTHPQIVENELIVETDHPHVGRVRQTRPAARFEGMPAEIRLQAPLLGEHTDEILAEAGIRSSEIADLRAAAIVS
jgi:crotonobetainyl-CoA:carnitine CoA-transferase CaiB-like acyl-CoA transferase